MLVCRQKRVCSQNQGHPRKAQKQTLLLVAGKDATLPSDTLFLAGMACMTLMALVFFSKHPLLFSNAYFSMNSHPFAMKLRFSDRGEPGASFGTSGFSIDVQTYLALLPDSLRIAPKTFMKTMKTMKAMKTNVAQARPRGGGWHCVPCFCFL
ncbi:hypothetical protein BC940DRAFT_86515 [Gongronella butleri]|nr:hypothetical protein BC940DRAFT_86515 [Gongronella butleri]